MGPCPTCRHRRAACSAPTSSIEGGRYKITRIYDNESWNPDLRAPLSAPGVDVSVGDFIVAINGIELRAPDNIYRLLDGTANRQTVLTVNSKPVMEGARQVTVVPTATEQALRTRAWVEHNRRLVDKLSNGQLAYVYVPNTGQGGYESFNRYYFAQQDKKGAIVDERYNGGGSAADYIVDVLGRDFDGYFNNVAGDRTPFTSPSAGIWGPKVMIINEMAGSGGDLMPYMFKRRKIGPLVGKRTWGGLVHTADTPGFIDGGSMIAPRGGFFTRDGKWAVENEGVAPDIDIENWPKDVIAGKDPQLERAVEEAMKLLKAQPVNRMTTEPPSPEWGKRKGGESHTRYTWRLNSASRRATSTPSSIITVSTPPRFGKFAGASCMATGFCSSSLAWCSGSSAKPPSPSPFSCSVRSGQHGGRRGRAGSPASKPPRSTAAPRIRCPTARTSLRLDEAGLFYAAPGTETRTPYAEHPARRAHARPVAGLHQPGSGHRRPAPAREHEETWTFLFSNCAPASANRADFPSCWSPFLVYRPTIAWADLLRPSAHR